MDAGAPRLLASAIMKPVLADSRLDSRRGLGLASRDATRVAWGPAARFAPER